MTARAGEGGRSVEDVLRERFGLTSFRPGQREVIGALLAQRGALAVFPTGGGKSLCYQLPALLLEGVTLVVSPLIALMKDQLDALAKRGIPAARLDSSLGLTETRAVQDALREGRLKLLYVAPERFSNERFLALLEGLRIALFAVDEAHCVSEWGHNFRPDYLKLAEAARELRAERVLALTATATPAVVEDICSTFGIPRGAAVVTGSFRPNLALEVTPVTAEGRDAVLLSRLTARPPGSTIVYVTLQKTAEALAERLAAAGLPARAYHAGLSPEERTAIQEAWMASDRGIVVATIAFGMGIDKADVRFVYHHNLPKGLESYSQEMGRAGRDGLPSTVELLACADDVPVLENFAHGDMPTDEAVRALVGELLLLGPTFDVSLSELSAKHDLRLLVLRTALTYLELAGVLRQGTPFYAGYEMRPLRPLEEVLGRFDAARARFLRDVFAQAKKGRTWYALDPAQVAAALGEDRERVVRALDYLEEQGLVETRPSDVRHRFTRLRPAEDAGALTRMLVERFAAREAQEVARVAQVLALAQTEGCLANALAAHFGEQREAPCGHCTFCRTGRAPRVPPPSAPPPLPAGLDRTALQALQARHPRALGHPRQLARFLCGLTSPALTREKLARHPWFGTLEAHRFSDVLALCRGT